MADGVVRIDVDLITAAAQAGAKALESTLKSVDIKGGAAEHVKQLSDALNRAGSSSENAKAKINGLNSTLQSQSRYWQTLASSQEKAGLQASAGVSRLNGLKTSLAATNAETEKARQKFEQLTQTEGASSAKTKAAGNAYTELQGKQAALAVEVGDLQKKYGNLTPAMAAAADKAGLIGDRFKAAGDKISGVGRVMTVGLTAPIVAGVAMAGKAAVSFDSQIKSMGFLLDDGSVSAKTLQQQLTGLGNASKRWSVQYGVSTSSINDGMSELIKKGYSYNQVLGAMPSILDATRASGDDFNQVMSVSTSTLEQFGLKSNNTATMLKNTQRVTDSLTFVANKTSAGFSDMGYAMEYVGPVAHGLNMSLEQTAAAIGLMSNQGIEGQKAGTSLRGALSALLTPSAQNEKGFKALGISVDAFKKGSIGLPDILDSIKAKSKTMTKQQLQSNLALAFGTEAQAGMNILVQEGGDALRNPTSETQKSTGYTKKLAETMNNTSQANVEKFKSSLNVLAITFGAKLLPQITSLVKEGTKLVTWFTNLDDGTQKAILKTAAFIALGGPLLSMIGRTASGIGSLFHGFQQVDLWLGKILPDASGAALGTEKLADSAGKASTQSGLLGRAFSAVTGKLGLFKTGASAAAGESTGLVAALGGIAPVLGVAGLAVAGGVAYWELYGKKAAESKQRVNEWGSDIGAAADKSADKMKAASGQISGAFTDTNHTVSQNAKAIVSGFNSMTAAAKKASKESVNAANSLGKSLGGSAQADLMKETAKEEAANNKRIKLMESNAKKAENITRNASKNNVALTQEQETQLENLRQSSAAQAVKTLNLSGKQQNNVLRAILGEKTKMTKDQAESQYNDMVVAANYEQTLNKQKMKQIKNDSTLSAGQQHAALEGLEQDHEEKMSEIAMGAIQAAKRRGDSESQIMTALQKAYGLTATEAVNALQKYDDAMARGTKATKGFAAVVNDDMSKNVKKAGNEWNSLVLNPKTGKVKTNLPEVLKDAANTKAGWKQLVFDLKYAKISSNAKQAIVDALAASKQWQSMPDWKKDAIITTQGRGDLVDVMQKFKTWNGFTLKQQTAIVHGDYTALVDALIKEGDWNQMTTKEKTAVVNDKASVPLINALVKNKQWNNLPSAAKTAVVTAKGTKELGDAVIKYGLWNNLPQKTKNLLINDADVRAKLIAAGLLIDKYNLNKPKKKTATADTANAQNNFGLGTKAVNNYKKSSPGPTKTAKAKDSASGPMKNAKGGVDKYRVTGTGPTKNAKGADLATPSLGKATMSANNWRGAGMGSTKTAKGKDSASTPIKAATRAWRLLGGNETISKTISFVASGTKSLLRKLGLRHGTMNWQGGLATINDETGPVYKELVIPPHGIPFTLNERNVTLPLAKGTQVITARKSAPLLANVPHFAQGTPGGLNELLENMPTAETASAFIPVSEDNSFSFSDAATNVVEKLTTAMGVLQQSLAALASATQNSPSEITIHNHVDLDKREMTRQLAEPIKLEINRQEKLANRWKGRV